MLPHSCQPKPDSYCGWRHERACCWGGSRRNAAFMARFVAQRERNRRAASADGGVTMTEHAVVIAGGGPTGLMLAAELALARVDVAIVERRANQDLAGSRAGGLHSRTIEVLDQRGIAERFSPQGRRQVAGLRDPARHQRLSDAPQLRARALAEAASSASWPTGSASWRCRSIAPAR